MSCKTEETQINDKLYVCTQFPAIKGMEFKLRLVKVLGPVIGEILPALKDLKSKDSEKQLKLVSSALIKLFESAEPSDIISLMVDMMTGGLLKCEGERITASKYDQMYAGDNMPEAYKVFIFVIRTNYAGFLKGQGGDLLAKAEGHL